MRGKGNTLRAQPRFVNKRKRIPIILSWLSQAFIGSLFVMAGLSCILGTGGTWGLFEAIGWGQIYRYVTGCVQLLGGLLFFFPRKAVYGAFLMSVTMLVAVGVHIFMIGGDPFPALVLFSLAALTFWFRRATLFSLGSRWRRGRLSSRLR